MSVRHLLSAVALLVVSVILTACGGDDDADSESASASAEPVDVTLSTSPWIGHGPLWIAQEQGLDRDHGVNLKLESFATTAEEEAAFLGGRVDGSNGSNNAWIRYADSGVDFKIVLLEDVSLEADAVVAGPGIESLADVAGKSVGVEELTTADLLLRYGLSQNGLSVDSVDYVPLPSANAGAALLAGRVDAAATYEPYISEALDQGDEFKVIYSAADRPGLISDSLIFTPEFAESNPDAVVGVLRAWNDAVEYYRTETKDAQAIIAENVGSKPEALSTAFDGVELYDLTQSQRILANDYEALWSDIAEVMISQGQIDSVPDVSDYVDTSYGARALEE